MKRTQAWNQANRAIRAACKDRDINDDQRKLILEAVTGKTSSADCTAHDLEAVLDHINSQTRPKRDFKPSSKGYVRKIWALWGELDTQGKLKAETKEEKRAALVSFVNKTAQKSYTMPDQLNWLTYNEAAPVIEALKKWEAR